MPRAKRRSEEDYYDLINEINLAQDLVRDRARDVRHCPDCEEGWVSKVKIRDDHPYTFASRCPCFGPWVATMRSLNQLGKAFYKQEGDDFANLVTQEMRDLHTVKGEL